MKRTPLHSVRDTRGFTLLEMVITLAVFVLLAGAVFGIMTGVMQGASSLQDNQNHSDQLIALNAFLKKKLAEMPAQSSLMSYRRGDGEGLDQNGLLFAYENLAEVIDAKVQANGYYTLRMASYDPTMAQNGVAPGDILSAAVLRDDPTLNWTPLVHDLKEIDWKFQDLNSTQWVDLWSNGTSKPNLIECSLQLAGDLQPITMDFWMPRLVPVSTTNYQISGQTGTVQTHTPAPTVPIPPHVP
jgi:prepilin-type N-terminal cleavage/methylation domain-containing protein